MAKAASSSARFRQRKISVKQTVQIIAQSDIPDLEQDEQQQRELQQVETGVEKGEEEEHHLQAAINASLAASTGAKVEQVYIPTPDASKKWPEYEKYYPKTFQEPSTYIRLSATVEDTAGCPYCMDEEDDEFLKQYNENKKEGETCTEDEFEMIIHKFESTIAERQPFLSMDPTQLLSLEELSPIIIQQITDAENDPSSPEFLLATTNSSLFTSTLKKTRKSSVESFKQFAKDIYPHWRDRKISRDGKSLMPTPKLEESEKDDSDPYVCFRRRELRQVRKTRRTDQQSSERLRKLQSEMEMAKRLMQMVVQREQMRRDALQLEWEIFEKRCMVKTVKRKLGIKGEDEDLVAHKKKKVEETPAQKRAAAAAAAAAQNGPGGASGPAAAAAAAAAATAVPVSASQSSAAIHQIPAYVRLPISKIPDMELTLLENVTHDKETAIRRAVKNKLKQRSQQDREWVNYTDNPFVPYCDYFDPDIEHRNNLKVVDPKYAAYSSIGAPYPPSCDVPLKLPLAASLGSSYAARVEASPVLIKASFQEDGDLVMDEKVTEKDMVATGSFNVPRSSALSLRKRRGRGGRIMIDRRGLVRRPATMSWDVGQDDSDHDPDEYHQNEAQDNNAANQRLEDRYKYDSDMKSDNMEFSCSDPSRLNGISNDTQAIRFGAMLLAKSYDSYREAYKLRQQHLMQMQQKLLQVQQQQQQLQLQQQQQQQLPGIPGQIPQHLANGTGSALQPQNNAAAVRPSPVVNGRPNGTPVRPNGNGSLSGGKNNSNNNNNTNNGNGANGSTMSSMKMGGTPPTKVEG